MNIISHTKQKRKGKCVYWV